MHVRRALFVGQADDGVRAATIAADVTAGADPYFSDSTDGALRVRVASQGNPAARLPAVGECDWEDYQDVARWAAAQVGSARASTREPVVLYTPRVPGCDQDVHTDRELGVTWIMGAAGTTDRRERLTRGLGQALGLAHSDADLCGPYWVAPGEEDCFPQRAADPFDVMGAGTGPLNAAQLDALGLLDEENTVRPSAATEVELQPVGGLEGRRFLVLPDSSILYVEYRGAVGRDANLADGRQWCPLSPEDCDGGPTVEVRAGVVIHGGYPARDGYPTTLLDPRSAEPAREPGAPLMVLEPGRSWVSPTGAWRVTTVAAGTSATVRVEPHLPPQPWVHMNLDRWHDGVAWTRSSTARVTWEAVDVPHLEGFRVLVDGEVRAEVGRDAREARVALDEGRNTVTVQSVGNGTTQDGDRAYELMRDSVAPRFSPLPRLDLSTGAVTTTRAPATLRWGTSDDRAVSATVLRYPLYRNLGARTTYPVLAKAGVNPYRMSVVDRAGNDTSVRFQRSVEVRGEAIATARGTWSRVSGQDLLHGAALRSTTAGASLSLTTTARSIGFVGVTGPDAGRVTVYVDGTKVRVVDLRSSTTGSRVVWAKNWIHPGSHTVKLVVEGTSGRPAVVADGFVIQR